MSSRWARQPGRGPIGFGSLGSLVLLLSMAGVGCLLPGDPPFDPLDADPPRLVETVPMQGALRVPPDAVILLAFSEPLAAGQPGPGQLRLASGELIAPMAIETLRPGLLSLVPHDPLLAGARYRLQLEDDIRDRAFNPLAGPRALTFTVTGADAPLQVVRTSPAEGSTGLGLRPTITLTFDVPISELSLEVSPLVLEDETGQARRLRVVLSEQDAHQVVLTPLEDLLPATRQTLTVSVEVRDVQSRHLALPFRLSFTTG